MASVFMLGNWRVNSSQVLGANLPHLQGAFHKLLDQGLGSTEHVLERLLQGPRAAGDSVVLDLVQEPA